MSDWKKIAALFDAALDRPPEERSAWLKEACGGNQELLREVQQMLVAHEKAEGILDRPIESLAGDVLPASDEPPVKDRSIGPYRLVKEIGRGGMGVVYQAHDPRLDRFVALKLLPIHLQDDHRMKDRFITEAKAASALDHPNICTIYDVGESEDGRLYISMAFYEGQTLEQRIQSGPLALEEGIGIAQQIAAGLAGAHEAGIVHRDIKPSNVVITKRGDVKILDFGVAKIERASGLTQPGALVGTVSYMSPEQTRGEEADHRSDLWSLGVILYEMLTGEKPFQGKSDITIAQAIVQDEPPRPNLPEDLSRVLERALIKDPRLRYASAEQLVHDLEELRTSSVKPAASRQRRPATHNLPVLLTSFVGRSQECRSIKALLNEVRLVTLTGPAGTGKSRLAVQVVQDIAGDFADGVYFVPLGSISDPNLVVTAIAQALGVPESSPDAPLSAVRKSLGDRQVLLILDNFEQVAAAASVVAELLESCSGLKLLATSRVVLRLSGEHEFLVAPLELPRRDEIPDLASLQNFSAVRLFVERARAVKPEFALNADNARSVTELCTRLDGLPLAIELAAARTKLLSPRSMLDRLSRRFDLLKGGPRDRPARQQTLKQAIEWSYDLLDRQQQVLFRRLSVFIGGLSLEAAEEMTRVETPMSIDAVDGLEALVDHSLLRAQPEPREGTRFFMLETIREYAWEKLEEEKEQGEVSHAHAQYFLSLAERAEPMLTGPEQTLWLNRLEADRGNLHRALEWAEEMGASDIGLRLGAALWRFWLVRGYSNEGRERLERIVSRRDAGARTKARARALHGLGTLAHNQGDNIKARVFLDEALSIWTELGDKKGMADELNNLGWVACELNDLETGQSLSEQGLALNRELGQERGIAVALNNLGWVAHYRGDYHAAKGYHEKSLGFRRRIGDRRGIGFALSNVAWAEGYHGNYVQAEKLLGEAMAIVREVDDKVLLGWVLNVEGMLAHDQGDPSRAAAALEEGLSFWEEAGNRSLLAFSLTTFGSVMNEKGDLERAEEMLERGLAEWKVIGASWGVAAALYHLGEVAYRKGDRDGAFTSYRESLMLRRDLGDQRGIAEGFEAMARLFLDEDKLELATQLFAAAQRLRNQLGVCLPPRRLSDDMDSMEKLKSKLRETFENTWAAGQQMPIDECLTLCLGE